MEQGRSRGRTCDHHRERQQRYYHERIKTDPERLEHRRMVALASRYRALGTQPEAWSKLSWYCAQRQLVVADVVAGRQRLPVP